MYTFCIWVQNRIFSKGHRERKVIIIKPVNHELRRLGVAEIVHHPLMDGMQQLAPLEECVEAAKRIVEFVKANKA